MNKHIYPRHMDMRVFIRWYNGGDSLFLGQERKQTLQSMKDLVERMDMPTEYEDMRRETVGASKDSVRGARFGQGPSREFRRGMGDAMRMCGYVYYAAPGAPHMGLVPLEPQQMHLLRLLIRGHSTAELAEALATERANIRWRLNTLRRCTGAATTSQAIATAYQHRWLPSLAEERALINQGSPVVPGLLIKSTVSA